MSPPPATRPRDVWTGLAIAALLGLLAGSALLRPGFYDSHDGLLNVHRLFELEKCLADGQLPCRWVPDMGAGYGYPLFNFYPPLPSFVAEGFRLLGATLLDAVKWAFLLALVVGAVGTFRLAAGFFGVAGGVLAAALYTFAPYQAVDVFVRGALAETWGMALLPWVFSSGYRAVTDPGKTLRSGLACGVAWAALLLSHDITALMVAPFYAVWLVVAWRSSDRGLSNATSAAAGHVLALGLAGFFVLPLLFELQYVHADTLVSLYPWARFENNFVDAGQLLLAPAPWGYGALGSPKPMSLFVGGAQLVFGVGGLVALGVRAARTRRLEPADRAALFFGAAGIAAIAMIVPGARVLWDSIPVLAFLQFPWRFLGVASLGLSLAAGWSAFALRSPPALAWAAAAIATVVVVATGWEQFEPSSMHEVRAEALANERQISKARHGLFDFLPRSVELDHFISNPPPLRPPAVQDSGGAVIRNAKRSSDRIRFDAEVEVRAGGEAATLRLGVFDFPGWTLELDGEPAAFAPSDDPIGRLHVRVPPGSHTVEARFQNTPVRSFSNALSALALLAAFAWTAAVIRSR